MDNLNILILIIQVIVGILFILGWRWLKELPSTMHKSQQKFLQHELNQKLEHFKTSLSKELELLKISHAELQIRKTEEFINFGNIQRQFLTDKTLLSKLESGDKKAKLKIQNQILDLSTGLFFFASDDTVRKYGEWKSGANKGSLEGIELLRQFGKLMVVLRKDLGQKDTHLNENDYLRLFITDWYKYE